MIGEVFNLFNAINPAFNVGAVVVGVGLHRHGWPTTRRNTVFMKPNAYAGDNGQPEQRVGQVGFRFVF